MASKKNRNRAGPTAFLLGKLLVALPGMPDPRFEKSVISCAPTRTRARWGSSSIKPFEGLSFREMVAKLDVTVEREHARSAGPLRRTGRHPPGLRAAYLGIFGQRRDDARRARDFADRDRRHPARHRRGPRAGEVALRARLCRMGAGPDRGRAHLERLDPVRGRSEVLSSGTDCEAKWKAALATLGADISRPVVGSRKGVNLTLPLREGQFIQLSPCCNAARCS